MKLNIDVNILGGLSDLNLIKVFLDDNYDSNSKYENHQEYSNLKTIKSFKRYEKAIKNTLIKFHNNDIKSLVKKVVNKEGISNNSLFILFLNASINNDLLNYLNQNVFFPALYSGRVTIKSDEVVACLKELRCKEESISGWSESSIKTIASKYLTLLSKFNLMEGRTTKTIANIHLTDDQLILFVYWVLAVESKSNLLESNWLQYCFLEKELFIQRVMNKKFMKYFTINFSGDNLKIKNNFGYEVIYDELN